MIKNYDNEKITANQKAKLLILDKLVDLDWSWCEDKYGNPDIQGLTDKEIENISLQVRKRINSIYKVFGYIEPYDIK